MASIFFIAGVVASVIVTIILFFVWNRPDTHYSGKNNLQLKNYSVDNCVFTNSGVNISGWAFIPEENFSLNQVFIMKNDGEVKGLITGLVVRGDVSKAFSKTGLYSKSGFVASRLDKDAISKFKKEIIITSTSKSGTTYAATHTCN